MQEVPKRDATDPGLQQVASLLYGVAALSPWPDWCFAQLALALARDCIIYQLDTDRVGREQIDGFTDPYVSPLLPFTRGVDDCDAKARIFVALCLARHIDAEMVPRWKGENLAHVYAKCLVKMPHAAGKTWQFAETILRRARLGETSDNVPKEPETGKWMF